MTNNDGNPTNLIFVGIDPGKSGAMCAISALERPLCTLPYPGDIVQAVKLVNKLMFQAIYHFLSETQKIEDLRINVFVAIEKIIIFRRPQQKKKGKKGDFAPENQKDEKDEKPQVSASGLVKNAKNQGEWVGMMYAFQELLKDKLEITVTEVAPQTWVKVLAGQSEGKTLKDKVKNYTKQRYPEYVIGPRGGYLSGVADALVIALWQKRQIIGLKGE